MLMIRRMLSLTLALCLILSLTACGSSQEPDEPADPPETEELSLREPEPEPEKAIDPEEPEAEDAPEDSGAVSNTETSPVINEESIQPLSSAGSPFQLNVEKGIGLFLYNSGDYTVSMAADSDQEAAFARIINGMDRAVTQESDQKSQMDLMVVLPDYTKYIYSLTANSIRMDGEDTEYVLLTDEIAALKKLRWMPSAYPQWLIYMNPNRVKSMSYSLDAGSGQLCQEDMDELLPMVRHFTVEKGTGKAINRTDFPAPVNAEENYTISMVFDNGIEYAVWRQGSYLYVQSSDMSYGIRYNLFDSPQADIILERLKEMHDGAGTPENPSTAKPVIYLYPTKATDVDVQLDFQGKLSYTFPEYRNGWSVTAQPDGTLTDLHDGSTHYYLFWDGWADRKDWDLSTGFVIKGSETQGFLLETLPKLGLTPKEYNDFITYWVPEMSGNAYNLINFSTTQYEETAKLNITPKPDTVLRVHMVYKALEQPVEIPRQQLPKAPARSGFTVVEWGGTRA